MYKKVYERHLKAREEEQKRQFEEKLKKPFEISWINESNKTKSGKVKMQVECFETEEELRNFYETIVKQEIANNKYWVNWVVAIEKIANPNIKYEIIRKRIEL